MKDEVRKEVLNLLDIRDENNFSDIELFKLLDKKRKSVHPDRTTDDDVRAEYENKIKIINELYKRFGDLIKTSSLTETGLQIHKGEVEFDYISSKLDNDELRNKIKNLENEIFGLKNNIENKNQIITRLNDTKVKEETEKLKELFKPKTSNLIFLGVSAFLSGLILVLSSTEQAVNFYSKNLPMLNPHWINIMTLGILLFVTLIFIINYLKKLIVNKWTEIIKSTNFNSKLFDFVKENTEKKTESQYVSLYVNSYKFKERVIYNFIDSFFTPKWKIISVIRNIVGLNTYSVFENLKKIVIYELINKGILNVSGNSGFDKILRYEE